MLILQFPDTRNDKGSSDDIRTPGKFCWLLKWLKDLRNNLESAFQMLSKLAHPVPLSFPVEQLDLI